MMARSRKRGARRDAVLIRPPIFIPSSEITPEAVYLRRRDFMRGAAALAGAGLLPESTSAEESVRWRPLGFQKNASSAFSTNEALTPFRDVTSYNNFYEFGTDKSDPAERSAAFKPLPWRVTIEGEVERPADYALEDLLRGVVLEERIYRLRCVEAWSMVIPWVGFPLSLLLSKVGLTSRAKFVEFTTVKRPAEMPGQRSPTGLIDWPYREGLRIDEAMHPLVILAVGLYGRELPNQNGAPLRLVVPWKYGFKSAKSIVRIRLLERQPATSWSRLAPHEYGFFANVNPEVDHPRWSQKFERRLPNSLFNPNRIPTQIFNGYADQVAHLYRGMNLRKYF
jgi:sulfoxide reductase catalytic subunit YedY